MGCTEHEKLGGDPDGQGHLGIAGRAGRPDLQRRVSDLYAEIAPKLDAIDQEFAEEHGFGFRPRIKGTGDQVDEPIVLTLYGPDGELAAIELLPKRCLTLAKEILDTAVRAIKVDWPG